MRRRVKQEPKTVLQSCENEEDEEAPDESQLATTNMDQECIEDEPMSSQQLLQDLRLPPPDTHHPFKPGTLISIKLLNFMCHESFELAFGPRVNFIIGPNGSGKSALLTALVVALGGRATTTSRARKNSDFVMYGKKFCKISVVIHNYERIMDKGEAFKPDEYGKTITVEKIIYKDDISKLTLKNDKDKRVSERKQELDDMLDHFGILINNPICILNQEVSKTFLHSKKPEDKFELFMKATNLEQIEQDYDAAYQSHKQWDDCNTKNTVTFRLLDAEYNSCKEKTGFLEDMARIKDTLSELNRELIWALARDEESLNDELNIKLQTIESSITEANIEIERRKTKIKHYQEDIQLLKTNMQTILAQMEESKKKLTDIRNKETSLKTDEVNIKSKINLSERKISQLKIDQASLERSIADIKRKFREQDGSGQDIERRKIEMERLEKEIAADNAKETSIRRHNDQLSSSLYATRTELHGANTRSNSLKGKLSQSQALLRRLKNGQANSLMRYGEYAVQIQEEIDKFHNQGRFKHKPIGPLGYYLKLRCPDIACPLELHLGRNANAYACDNHKDMATLSSIFKRLNLRLQPVIITRPFGSKHDITRFKATHDVYKSFLDHLDIENEVVFNALVDRCFIESVLFIPEYSEAEALLINPATVPRNTRCAYTKDCSVMHPRTANSGYRSFANNSNRYSLFAASNTVQIREVEREIDLISAELRDAENVAKSIQDSLAAQKSEYEGNAAEAKRLMSEIRKKEEQLLNLRTTLAMEPQEVVALETELDSCTKRIDEEKLNIDGQQELLASVQADIANLLAMKEATRDVISHQEDKRQSIHKMTDSTKANIEEAQRVINRMNIIIENRTTDKGEVTKQIEASLKRMASSQQCIPSNVPRPSTIRRTEEVKDEIRKRNAQLKAQEEETQDPEELMATLQKRMKEIESLTKLKNSNLSNFARTTKTLDERREGFITLRQVTVSAVCTTFSTVMRSMRMYGRLQIHLDDVIHRGEVVKKARTLEMHIDTNYTPSQRVGSVMSDSNNNRSGRRLSRTQPASSAPTRPKRARTDATESQSFVGEKENGAKMTDARSLSGGERSFSTVAFVLSLWHHCASPFKLMDEIDVFMDMVTRRVSYNALIRFAQCADDPGQFIFFSPLELPKFDNSGSFVRVFEMPAIVRKRPISQITGGDSLEAGNESA